MVSFHVMVLKSLFFRFYWTRPQSLFGGKLGAALNLNWGCVADLVMLSDEAFTPVRDVAPERCRLTLITTSVAVHSLDGATDKEAKLTREVHGLDPRLVVAAPIRRSR